MFTKMLSRLGYDVTACGSAAEALRLVDTNPRAFDLVITDFAMPQMNGVELAKAIRGIRPDLPILLCTGVSQRLSLEEMTPHGISEILLKPVFSTELDAKIRLLIQTRG
jgi:CheY-like chemotaxis protein